MDNPFTGRYLLLNDTFEGFDLHMDCWRKKKDGVANEVSLRDETYSLCFFFTVFFL